MFALLLDINLRSSVWRCRCLCSPTRTQNYYGIAFSFFLSFNSISLTLETWNDHGKNVACRCWHVLFVLSFAYSNRALFFMYSTSKHWTLLLSMFSFLARHSQSDIVNCMSNKRIKNRINEPPFGYTTYSVPYLYIYIECCVRSVCAGTGRSYLI